MDEFKLSIDPIDLEKPNLADEIDRYDYDFKLVSGIKGLDKDKTPSVMARIWIFNAGTAVRAELRRMTWDRPDDEFDLEKVKARLLEKRGSSGQPSPPPSKKVKLEKTYEPAVRAVSTVSGHFSDGGAGSAAAVGMVAEQDVKPVIQSHRFGGLLQRLDELRDDSYADATRPRKNNGLHVMGHPRAVTSLMGYPEVTLEQQEIFIFRDERGQISTTKLISGCFVGENSSRVAVCPEDSLPWLTNFTNKNRGGNSTTMVDREQREIPFKFSTAHVAETEKHDKLLFVDRSGFHVHDAMTLRRMQSNGGVSPTLVGLACFGEDTVVTFDDQFNHLVFFNVNEAAVAHVKRVDEEMVQWRDQESSTRPIPKSANSKISRIRALAVHKVGRSVKIALVDWGKSRVYLVDDLGNLLQTIENMQWPSNPLSTMTVDGCQTFNHPTGAAFLPDGRLFVSDTDNDRLLLFDENGRFLQKMELPEPVTRPSFLQVKETKDGKCQLLVGFLGAPWEKDKPSGFAVFHIGNSKA